MPAPEPTPGTGWSTWVLITGALIAAAVIAGVAYYVGLNQR